VNTDKGDRFGLRRSADDLIDLEIRRHDGNRPRSSSGASTPVMSVKRSSLEPLHETWSTSSDWMAR
jgi:hypothetical protein